MLRVAYLRSCISAVVSCVVFADTAAAQVAPSQAEVARYTGLFGAAATGNTENIKQTLAAGADPRARDTHARTPLHVAAHFGHRDAVRALVAGGADPRALDSRRYDIVTIAAVRNDVAFVRLALELGADAKAVTSPYDGTAPIAAAHLGHNEVVEALIAAGAPLDHVNNLGWTAPIEAIVLGDGGARHMACVRALLDGGANPNLADRQGESPRALAHKHGFAEMVRLIERVGGK